MYPKGNDYCSINIQTPLIKKKKNYFKKYFFSFFSFTKQLLVKK